MAPRKQSKGKKPLETMRQRQMRLRKMEQASKNSSKKLPPGKRGGDLKTNNSIVRSPGGKASKSDVEKVKVRVESPKQLSASKTRKALPPGKNETSRSAQALAKQARAAAGSKGSGVRTGYSSSNLSKNPYSAASQAAKSAKPGLLGRVALPIDAALTAKNIADREMSGKGIVGGIKNIADTLRGNGRQQKSARAALQPVKAPTGNVSKGKYANLDLTKKEGSKPQKAASKAPGSTYTPRKPQTPAKGSSAPSKPKSSTNPEVASIKAAYDKLRERMNKGEISKDEMVKKGMEMHNKYYNKKPKEDKKKKLRADAQQSYNRGSA